MPYYRRVGEVPHKRHLRVAQEDGTLCFEELMGANGFAQESALLYHRRSPSAIVAAQLASDAAAPRFTPDLPLVPRHLRTGALPGGGDPVLGRHYLMGNADLRLAWVQSDSSSGIYRNAVGDELVYVQSGRAVLESSFGSLPLGPGD